MALVLSCYFRLIEIINIQYWESTLLIIFMVCYTKEDTCW